MTVVSHFGGQIYVSDLAHHVQLQSYAVGQRQCDDFYGAGDSIGKHWLACQAPRTESTWPSSYPTAISNTRCRYTAMEKETGKMSRAFVAFDGVLSAGLHTG